MSIVVIITKKLFKNNISIKKKFAINNKKIMTQKIRLTVPLLLLLTLVGCKTKQSISTAIGTDTISQPKTETATEQSDSLMYKRLDYNWISYRATASISNFEPKNLNVFMVNRKDSIIYITVSKMGIEGGRLVLTPDSVKMLNHINSNYYVGNYSILEQLVGLRVDFYMIQSLLVGEDLPEHTKSFIQASYGNFTTIDTLQFFQQADFVVPKENLQVNISVKNIRLNEPGPTSIRIPEKYTPIK